jgi:hypothetical protein
MSPAPVSRADVGNGRTSVEKSGMACRRVGGRAILPARTGLANTGSGPPFMSLNL